MAWKLIKGHRYLYRSRREGGRVISEYVGTGEVAGLIGALDAIEAQERDLARFEERARLRALAEQDRELARYHRGVQLVFVAEMADRGFHQHDRGEWRRVTIMAKTKAKTPATTGPRAYTLAECQAIVDKCQDGDKSALPELRALLKDAEWRDTIIECVGSPAGHCNHRLIAGFSGDDLLAIKECMSRKVDALRTCLTPPDAGPVEKLLASRVATCWLAVCLAECQAARGTLTPRELDVRDRRAHRCHARLLSSIRALTAIRRADAPAVNVMATATAICGGGGARPPAAVATGGGAADE